MRTKAIPTSLPFVVERSELRLQLLMTSPAHFAASRDSLFLSLAPLAVTEPHPGAEDSNVVSELIVCGSQAIYRRMYPASQTVEMYCLSGERVSIRRRVEVHRVSTRGPSS